MRATRMLPWGLPETPLGGKILTDSKFYVSFFSLGVHMRLPEWSRMTSQRSLVNISTLEFDSFIFPNWTKKFVFDSNGLDAQKSDEQTRLTQNHNIGDKLLKAGKCNTFGADIMKTTNP